MLLWASVCVCVDGRQEVSNFNVCCGHIVICESFNLFFFFLRVLIFVKKESVIFYISHPITSLD